MNLGRCVRMSEKRIPDKQRRANERPDDKCVERRRTEVSRDERFAGRGSVFKVPFVPDTPILKYARSYLPSQYACLSCGFMGFVLQQSDLVKLRKENEARGT